jgi:hypothetical protein
MELIQQNIVTRDRMFLLTLVFTLIFFNTTFALAYTPFKGHAVVQLGGIFTHQGQSEHVNTPGLIGSQYTVNTHSASNGLVGLGYYLDGLDRKHFQINYGINTFYIAKAPVNGGIVLENTFHNLNYSYQIQNIPIYFSTQSIIKTNKKQYNVTLDAGLGPNVMQVSQYQEAVLTTYTIPSNNFATHHNVTLTAMAGLGLRRHNFFGKAPLECGYRFFYLGNGHLQINNTQITNPLKTGNVYANAVICSIIV